MQGHAHAAREAGEHERLYRARSGVAELVEVPPARFLALDGSGRPGDQAYQDAIAALFAVAYTARFACKKAGGPTVKIPPLEGLYHDPSTESFDADGRRLVHWTLLLRLPAELDDHLVELARAEAARRRPFAPLDRVRIMELAEGTCVQALHVGPYSTESATIDEMSAFMRAHGLEARGLHHEIYLGDPRRAAPERLKTILRQPV
jgi:hypothetical protein